MSDAILRYFKLYKLPPGRRIHALTQVSERARELGFTAVAEHADMAIVEDRKILDMERQRSGDRRALYGEDAVALDHRLDRAINAFDQYITLQAQAFGGAHPRVVAAGVLRKELLPRGAGAVTVLTYVQEHAAINSMLERAKESAVAEAVAALPDARLLLDAVADINARYGASLGAYSNMPSATEIKMANDQGHVRMCEVVSMIFTQFATNPDADLSQRDYLLESIDRQNEAARQLRRRRRTVADIDPDADQDTDQDTDIDPDMPDVGTGSGTDSG